MIVYICMLFYLYFIFLAYKFVFCSDPGFLLDRKYVCIKIDFFFPVIIVTFISINITGDVLYYKYSISFFGIIIRLVNQIFIDNLYKEEMFMHCTLMNRLTHNMAMTVIDKIT